MDKLHLDKLSELDLNFMRQREDHAATQGSWEVSFSACCWGWCWQWCFAPARGDETRAAVANTAVAAKDKAVDLVHQSPIGRSSASEEAADGLLNEGGSPTI